MKCPQCKNGKMSISVSVYGKPKESDTVSEIDCVHCHGTGEVSEEENEAIEFEKNLWCECGNKNDVVDYYEDGEHPELHKHHYRCRNCKGVVQIG